MSHVVSDCYDSRRLLIYNLSSDDKSHGRSKSRSCFSPSDHIDFLECFQFCINSQRLNSHIKLEIMTICVHSPQSIGKPMRQFPTRSNNPKSSMGRVGSDVRGEREVSYKQNEPDFRRITDPLRGIYRRLYLKRMKAGKPLGVNM